MLENRITNFVKSNIQHFITGSVTILYLWLVAIDRPISPEFEWSWRVIMIFWFGYTVVQKAGNFIKATALTDPKNGNELPKANGQTVLPTATVEEPVGEDIPEIPFNEEQFIKETTSNVASDYAGVVSPATEFYEARDKTLPRWLEEGKINSKKGLKDAWEVILGYAKYNMAYAWTKVIAGDVNNIPSAFQVDPIGYVNSHFADFRNCPSCKDKVSNQQVGIKWLALNLGEGTYVSYLDLLNALKSLSDINEELLQGNQVW